MVGEAGDFKGLRDPPQALPFKEARAFLFDWRPTRRWSPCPRMRVSVAWCSLMTRHRVRHMPVLRDGKLANFKAAVVIGLAVPGADPSRRCNRVSDPRPRRHSRHREVIEQITG